MIASTRMRTPYVRYVPGPERIVRHPELIHSRDIHPRRHVQIHLEVMLAVSGGTYLRCLTAIGLSSRISRATRLRFTSMPR